jgi:hypothetical protein
VPDHECSRRDQQRDKSVGDDKSVFHVPSRIMPPAQQSHSRVAAPVLPPLRQMVAVTCSSVEVRQKCRAELPRWDKIGFSRLRYRPDESTFLQPTGCAIVLLMFHPAPVTVKHSEAAVRPGTPTNAMSRCGFPLSEVHTAAPRIGGFSDRGRRKSHRLQPGFASTPRVAFACVRARHRLCARRSIGLRPGSRARFIARPARRAVHRPRRSHSAHAPPSSRRTLATAFGPAGRSATKTGGTNRLAGKT